MVGEKKFSKQWLNNCSAKWIELLIRSSSSRVIEQHLANECLFIFFLLQHMKRLDFVSHAKEKGSVRSAQSLSAPLLWAHSPNIA